MSRRHKPVAVRFGWGTLDRLPEARGIIEYALGGVRGRNFVNPAPRLEKLIA